MTKLLTVHEVAYLTGWAPGTIRNKTSRGELPHVHPGRSLRFQSEAIAKLIHGAVDPAGVPAQER